MSLGIGAMVALVASCTPDDPGLSLVTGSELTSPAGEGSGEPFLSSTGDAVFMSWLERVGDGEHELRFSSFDGAEWAEPRAIQRSSKFFVNWADFPSVAVSDDGTLWAHWLERGEQGGYDYGVRVVRSADGGESWSEPWRPHEDSSPTEHGFVSPIPLDGGMGFAWLDGRNTGAGVSDEERAMTLRYRFAKPDGSAGPDQLLDARVCDCCQTDAAMASAGPVVVYRDRAAGEIRDIYITRMVDGAWTEGTSVHHDGWEIGGCPVNGPAVAAAGELVAVAWFTGAGDIAQAKVAFSADGGATFGEAVRIDGGMPIGRVDVMLRNSGTALVSWLEGTGGDGAQVRIVSVTADGEVGESLLVAESSSGRPSGFPRMIESPDGSVLVAWTDVQDGSRVRVRRLELEGA